MDKMRVSDDWGFLIHGFLYQLCILYALDVNGRVDEAEWYWVFGTGTLLCLLLSPTRLVDCCFKLGTCVLLMRDNYLWLMSDDLAHQAETIVWKRMNIYKMFYNILYEQTVSMYGYLMCTLVAFLLVAMTIRLLREHIQKMDRWLLVSFIFQILLYLATSSQSTNFRGIGILIPHFIISWFFCRMFCFQGYIQGVICSLFLLIENPKFACAFFLPWSIAFIVKILKDQEPSSPGVGNAVKLDMEKVLQIQYRKTLFVCLLYAIINISLPWIFNPNTSLMETMTVFCDSWIGVGCFTSLTFFTSRAIMVFTVYYLRGFENVRIQFENPGFSDVWLIIFLMIQYSSDELDNNGLYMRAGIIIMVSKLLHEMHDLSEPVLMELVAYKKFTRRQVLVFTYFVFVSVCPFLMYCVLTETLNSLNTWLYRVIIVCLMNTTVDCLISISFHFIIRFSFFRSNLENYTILILLFYCWSNVMYILCFIFWCISNIRPSIIGIVMPFLMVVYIYDQGQITWKTIKQRQSKIRRLKWRPSEWDQQLVDNGKSCSICLCEIDLDALNFVKMSLCKHLFHESCLEKWCGIGTSCPLCKSSRVHDFS